MKTKSFVLRKDTYSKILPFCDEETIAVVRPEKYVENLFGIFIENTKSVNILQII